MENYQGTTFQSLLIPLHVFQEGEFGFDDVGIEYTIDSRALRWDEDKKNWLYNFSTDTRIPLDIKERIPYMAEERRKEAAARGATFFDGQQARLAGYVTDIEEGEERKFRVILRLAPTSFVTYQATNFCLDEMILKDTQGNPTTIRKKYSIDPLILNDCLANPIGVNTTLISETDGNMIIVERSMKIQQYPGLYGVAAAGFINRLRDSVADAPNPFKTIQRELDEEMGLKGFPLDGFRLFGIGRAGDDLHGELWGESRTKYTSKEIIEMPKKAKYENLKIIPVPFDVKEVLKYLLQRIDQVPKGIKSGLDTWIAGKSPKWVPAHAYATIQSLIEEYGYDKVSRTFNELSKEV